MVVVSGLYDTKNYKPDFNRSRPCAASTMTEDKTSEKLVYFISKYRLGGLNNTNLQQLFISSRE
jgi:hypothetical protein